MELDFEKMDGLIPAIIQDAESGKVLMLAYMNEIAWNKTLETGKAWFYSRSRDKQWMKGEESGNVQIVKEVFIDCDNDTVLLKVEQVGKAACHKGYVSCFFRKINGEVKIVDEKMLNEGVFFDGSSIAGWKSIHESDMLLKPDLERAIIDPFTSHSTLVLFVDVLDAVKKKSL